MKSIPRYEATTNRGKKFIVVALTLQTAWQLANERYPNCIVSLNDISPLNGLHLPEGVVAPECPPPTA